MNIKEYIKQYNKSFVEIQTAHLEYFNSLLEEDKVWLGNIECKLHLFENIVVAEKIQNVINKLKSDVNFNEIDTLIISEFISKINIIVNIADRINNFKENTLLENGSRLRVYELFNSIKSVNNFNELNISLNPNLNNFLPHLFSIIKHCQNPSQYPIYYKYWKNIVREVLCKKDDYDNFCLFYREFPLENRHLTFGSYLGTIGFQIAKNVKKNFPNITKESSEYKFLVDKVINIPRFTDVLDESLLNQYLTETIKYTKFHQIIQDFEIYLKGDDSKLPDFSFGPIHRNWVWIIDAQKIIGTDNFCHYEIITRKIKPNKLWVEIHFETNYKNHFKALFDNVESLNCFWNEDHKHPELSLAYNEAIDYDDINLFAKMEKALVHLETNFGDAIRNEFHPAELKEVKQNNGPTMKKTPLNQILFGPPGTGKTYNTINKSLSILESKSEEQISSENRLELKKRFEDYITTGQIVFTTFHQSMSYEDFIEGIKPIKPKSADSPINYKIEDGIFKTIVKNALSEYINTEKENNSDESFDSLYSKFVESILPQKGMRQTVFKTKTGVEMMLVDANEDSIQVKYLWSSKKKDAEGQHVFSVTKAKLKKTFLAGIVPTKDTNLIKDLHPIVGHIHCELFGVYKLFYDFVLENKVDFETIHYDIDELTFEEVKEQFDLLDKEEIKAKSVKPYILIIDEINRGNVSAIFGELITLIEDDKRLDKDEALEIKLPYSKEKFGVPSNLYIIGTMNTADRSVEALDTALRRRFSFDEMMPKTNLISPSAMYCRLLWKYEKVDWTFKEFKEQEESLFSLLGASDELKNKKVQIWNKMKSDKNRNDFNYFDGFIFNGVDLKKVLEKINERVEFLIGRDHTIGHSYFISVNTISDLKIIFQNKIIPLLQEYFFGDYGKIGLVLGKDFFEAIVENKSDNLFSDFYDYDGSEFAQRTIYKIRNVSRFTDEEMTSAISTLLK